MPVLFPVTAVAVIAAAPAPMPRVVTGVVRDGQTGKPLADAMVQQAGSVDSALSGMDGKFRLLTDPLGGRSVEVTCSGYETATVPLGSGSGLVIKLQLVEAPGVVAPASPLALEAIAAPETPLPPGSLGSELWLNYSLRGEWIGANGASQSGFANNNYDAGLRVRWHDWLAEGEGSHYQAPINVADLPREENPAYSPSTWEVGARLSRVWRLRPDADGALGLGYRWIDTVPNNKGIPYTSSPIDFEQSHHALGVVGQGAWRFAPSWTLEGLAGVYPVLTSWAQDPGTPYANIVMLNGGVAALYDAMPGLRVGLGYQVESWQGNGSDTSQLIGLQLRYKPAGLQ